MEESEILKLIPHRPPFVMVGKLISADEKKATSSFTVLADNVMTNQGVFTEAGLIENIAQTAALHAGFIASNMGKNTPQGMIGGIKNIEIQYLPKINDTINTMVTIEHEVLNAKLVNGKVYLNNIVIAECEMKVFLV